MFCFEGNKIFSKVFKTDSNIFYSDTSLLGSTAFIFRSNHKEFEITPSDSTCKILNSSLLIINDLNAIRRDIKRYGVITVKLYFSDLSMSTKSQLIHIEDEINI